MNIHHAPKIVVIGSINMDIVIEAERPPQMGETILGQKVSFLPGGKGANQAVALARLGAKVSLVGAVGKDAFGNELLGILQQEGIATHAVKTVEDVATGTAHILLSRGDNSIVVVPGANFRCEPGDVDRNEAMIADADAVLLQLEIPLETVVRAAQVAKKHGKTVILNPAPARELPAELLRDLDCITPNQSELALLANTRSVDEQSLVQAMKTLLKTGVGHVVTTLGAAGSAFLGQDGRLGRVNGHKVQVTDTTGAGDSFNAGLAYALSMGKSFAEAVYFAGAVSALSITKLGAQTGMPTMQEVDDFLK